MCKNEYTFDFHLMCTLATKYNESHVCVCVSCIHHSSQKVGDGAQTLFYNSITYYSIHCYATRSGLGISSKFIKLFVAMEKIIIKRIPICAVLRAQRLVASKAYVTSNVLMRLLIFILFEIE